MKGKVTRIKFNVWRKVGRRTESHSGTATVRAAWKSPLFHGLALEAIRKKHPGWNVTGYAKTK